MYEINNEMLNSKLKLISYTSHFISKNKFLLYFYLDLFLIKFFLLRMYVL